ncbi:MAG: hypothetical protein RLZZ86_1665 [Cyanobacteriota bacterium]|jgi:hypothetical protein
MLGFYGFRDLGIYGEVFDRELVNLLVITEKLGKYTFIIPGKTTSISCSY